METLVYASTLNVGDTIYDFYGDRVEIIEIIRYSNGEMTIVFNDGGVMDDVEDNDVLCVVKNSTRFHLSRRARWPKTFNKFVKVWAEHDLSEDPVLYDRLKRVLDKMEAGEWFTEFHPYNDEMLSFREL